MQFCCFSRWWYRSTVLNTYSHHAATGKLSCPPNPPTTSNSRPEVGLFLGKDLILPMQSVENRIGDTIKNNSHSKPPGGSFGEPFTMAKPSFPEPGWEMVRHPLGARRRLASRSTSSQDAEPPAVRRREDPATGNGTYLGVVLGKLETTR